MIQPREQEQLKDVLRKAWIVWAAMFCSLPIALMACITMADKLKSFAVQDLPFSISRNILLVLSAVIFIMIGNIRRFQLHGKSIAQRAARTAPAERGPDQILLKYMSVLLISLVLSEVIGVFGVLMFILSADVQPLYLFIALSAMAMLMHCPKFSEIQDIAAKMSK
jgi:hypothetical protein